MRGMLIHPRTTLMRGMLRRSYSIATSATDILAKKCMTCGSAFHKSGNTNDPGHRIEREVKSAPAVKASKNRQYDEMFKGLTEEQRKFVQQKAIDLGGSKAKPDQVAWTTDNPEHPAAIKAQKHKEMKERDQDLLCHRCFDVKSGKFPEVRQPTSNTADIIDSIPKQATVVHVLNGLDFPASFDQQIPNIEAKKVIYVVNKADLIADNELKAYERIKPYVDMELARKYRIRPSRVFVVSSTKKWGFDQLFDALSAENYFIGYANCGKSTLALEMARYYRAKLEHRPQALLRPQTYPWMTQGIHSYELKKEKILVDMPGFVEQDSIWETLKPSLIPKIVAGRTLLKDPGAYKSQRVVAHKPNHLLSFGGLVVVKRTTDHHLIAWPIAAYSEATTRVFGSFEKLEKWAAQSDEYKGWQHRFYHKPEQTGKYGPKLEYTIGPAGLTLCVRGVGILHMHIFGKIPPEGVPIEVYPLKGVDVVTRSNIMEYLRDTTNEDRKAGKLKTQVVEGLRLRSKK